MVMFTKPAALACVAALFLAGCGEGATEEVAPETLDSTEQAIIWACDGSSSWNRYWTVNGVEVGREYCDCGGILTQYGEQEGRYSQVRNYYCR